MNAGRGVMARLRELSRWQKFAILMVAVWPMILLRDYPVLALLVIVPATILFFIATSRISNLRATPRTSEKEPHDAP